MGGISMKKKGLKKKGKEPVAKKENKNNHKEKFI
jgi:hypothetical protein